MRWSFAAVASFVAGVGSLQLQPRDWVPAVGVAMLAGLAGVATSLLAIGARSSRRSVRIATLAGWGLALWSVVVLLRLAIGFVSE